MSQERPEVLISQLDGVIVLAVEQAYWELVRTEEALRVSEEKFASAFHSSPDPMAIASLKEGRYLEVNDSFLSVFGFAREEIIGHTHRHSGEAWTQTDHATAHTTCR